MAEDEELTDADWHTLCETLRGSISMFTMLLAECGDNSETARIVEADSRRRQKVLDKIERRLQMTWGCLDIGPPAGFRVHLAQRTLICPGEPYPLYVVSLRSSRPM